MGKVPYGDGPRREYPRVELVEGLAEGVDVVLELYGAEGMGEGLEGVEHHEEVSHGSEELVKDGTLDLHDVGQLELGRAEDLSRCRGGLGGLGGLVGRGGLVGVLRHFRGSFFRLFSVLSADLYFFDEGRYVNFEGPSLLHAPDEFLQGVEGLEKSRYEPRGDLELPGAHP